MRRACLAVLAVAPLMATVAGTAWAHGPTRQKVTESITINAAPDAVWARVKDFGAMNTWHPAVEACAAPDGNKIGSRRTLALKGGGSVVEELERATSPAEADAYARAGRFDFSWAGLARYWRQRMGN